MVIYFYKQGVISSEAFIYRSLEKYVSEHPGKEALLKTRLRRSDKGKPYFEENGVFVGVTHTAGIIAVAIGEEDFGIDMECAERTIEKREAIAKRFFFEKEKNYIDEGANDKEKNNRMLEMWVKKEAYLKCLGTGLAEIRRADTMSVAGGFEQIVYKNMVMYIYFREKRPDEIKIYEEMQKN